MAMTNGWFVKQPPKPYQDISPYVEELLSKKMTRREEALNSIVEALSDSTFKLELDFLKNNFATYLYRCLNLFKKGSSIELHLACRAIGLLALTVDNNDRTNEIYRETVPVVSKALKSGPKTLTVFECLAMATFFGASSSEETQKAMRLIWEFIRPEADSNVSGGRQNPPDVLVAAISAWLFLLSGLDEWAISSEYWRGVVPYFVELIENEEVDKSVLTVASAALALIFDMENTHCFVSKGETSFGEGLKQESGSFAKMVGNEYFQVLDYFRNEGCPREESSWAEIVQLNYVRNFLGYRGFNAHMQENPKLQNLFEYKPRKTQNSKVYPSLIRKSRRYTKVYRSLYRNYAPGKEFYVPTLEKVNVTCYLPREGDESELVPSDMKEVRVLRRLLLGKARTQLRTKTRLLATERKQTYGVDD